MATCSPTDVSESSPADSGNKSPGCYYKDFLRDKVNFPSFEDLPEGTIIDKRYWKDVNGQSEKWEPKCTWFFLGEITDIAHTLIPGPMFRKQVLVRDRTGKQGIPVSFYPKLGHFDFKQLKKGCTICILLAERHYFPDLTAGVCVENLDAVKLLQCGLNDLFSLSKTYAKRKDTKCWHCGKGTPQNSKTNGETVRSRDGTSRLRVCGSCKTARYCDKSCQAADWRKCHRQWCKVMPDFLVLTKTDLSKYDDNFWFTSIPCNKSETFETFLQTLFNL